MARVLRKIGIVASGFGAYSCGIFLDTRLLFGNRAGLGLRLRRVYQLHPMRSEASPGPEPRGGLISGARSTLSATGLLDALAMRQ